MTPDNVPEAMEMGDRASGSYSVVTPMDAPAERLPTAMVFQLGR